MMASSFNQVMKEFRFEKYSIEIPKVGGVRI